MYIKTEIYTNSEGIEMKKDYYGNLLENGEYEITTTIETENVESEPIEPQVSNNEIRDMISNVEDTQLTQLMALADIYEKFLSINNK